jgi:succinate dehydrogenase / fumarate reductase membrane anchor subunit
LIGGNHELAGSDATCIEYIYTIRTAVSSINLNAQDIIGQQRSRVRGLGSAKSGTRDFWIQRLTAAANVPLALLLIAFIVALTGADYATFRSYLGNPLVAIPMLLLVLSRTWHMRIGMRVILEDYIYKEGPKVVLLALNNLFSAVVAIAGVYAILKIGIQS